MTTQTMDPQDARRILDENRISISESGAVITLRYEHGETDTYANAAELIRAWTGVSDEQEQEIAAALFALYN